MTNKEKQTEDKIAEAAREIFIEKGMAGARMQEIADSANINKALTMIGYKPLYTFKEGIKLTLGWYVKENKND